VIFCLLLAGVLATWYFTSYRKLPEYHPIRMYGRGGIHNINPKIWCDTITITNSNGFSIDISSAGFTNIMTAEVIVLRNTATATSVPKVSIKSITTTALVINVIEGNPNTVNLLGSLVSLGVTESFAANGLLAYVMVCGN